MSFASDIQATSVTSSSTAVNKRARLAGVIVTYNNAGTINFRDGGSSGDIKFTLVNPVNPSGPTFGMYDALIPDNGILFTTNMYVQAAGVTNITIMYVG